MYVWIWRHLPGGTLGKALGSMILLLLAITVLMLVVFPWIEPHMPFRDVTVGK